MKNYITKITLLTVIAIFSITFKSEAQVTVATAGQFACEGQTITLPSPGTDKSWVVRYDANSATPSSPTTLTLTSNTIAAADVKTGYYLISTTSSDPTVCSSDAQTIALFVLPTLTPSFTSSNYCSENASITDFVASVTPTTPPTGATISYQWYTVISGAEAAITGETNATFHPTITNTTTSPVTATYRLKAAYKIGSTYYCEQIVDKSVTVLPKSTVPTITLGSTGSSTL